MKVDGSVVNTRTIMDEKGKVSVLTEDEGINHAELAREALGAMCRAAKPRSEVRRFVDQRDPTVNGVVRAFRRVFSR